MRAVFAVAITIAALGLASLSAVANTKKCKPGQEYDEVKGKCVVVRGS